MPSTSTDARSQLVPKPGALPFGVPARGAAGALDRLVQGDLAGQVRGHLAVPHPVHARVVRGVAGAQQPRHLVEQPGRHHLARPVLDATGEHFKGYVFPTYHAGERFSVGGMTDMPPGYPSTRQKGHGECSEHALASPRDRNLGPFGVQNAHPAHHFPTWQGTERILQGGPPARVQRRLAEDGVGQDAQEETGAAHQQRHASPRPDLRDPAAGVAAEVAGAVAFAGVADVETVVRNERPLARSGLGSADVHAPVHLPRVHRDDLGASSSRATPERERGLARAGAADDGKEAGGAPAAGRTRRATHDRPNFLRSSPSPRRTTVGRPWMS